MTVTGLTEQDIRDSQLRLQAAFEGDYGAMPLSEGSRKVGSLSTKDDTIFLTFRGSVNSFLEILSCLYLTQRDAQKWGLEGKVHAGIHAGFCQVEKSIESYLDRYPSLKGKKIVLEGYSRGSAFAMLAAAYLVKRFAADRLTVITYSPMNLFDLEGAKSYEKKIQNQFNFICKDDFFPKWVGPSFLGFCAVGKNLMFCATESISYLERVQKKAYTHLIRLPLLGTFLRCIIPLRLWEAHMPETYRDGSLIALRKQSAL